MIGYRKVLSDHPISMVILEEFNEWIRCATKKGIKIIAFRVPSIPEMWALEDSLSGFDTLNIPQQIEDAGGVWLEFPADGYESFDASHMTKESAIKFSNQLADSLQQIFNVHR